MKTKKVFPSELAYVFGVLTLAVGTAFMERADFGMSMVTAPAYVIHLKVSQTFPPYTFGTSTYVFQAFLLVLLCVLIRKFRKGYLFSFVTAVIFGNVLDLCLSFTGRLPADTTLLRSLYYTGGMILCALGVSQLFHTYIPPEAYELFVKETAAHFGRNTGRVKTVYDCCSCALGVLLSFCFFGFGRFEGVKLGTIFCALVNGRLIGMFSDLLEEHFDFTDALPLRRFFS